MQQQQGMTTPPPVISTKDHLYLQDMLNWNLLAMKKRILWRTSARISLLKQNSTGSDKCTITITM